MSRKKFCECGNQRVGNERTCRQCQSLDEERKVLMQEILMRHREEAKQ